MKMQTDGVRRVLVLMVMAALALVLSGTIVQAQDTPATPTQVELVGVIQAMSLDTIAVNGQIINVTTAQLKTSLEIGKAVKIEAVVAPNGSLIAREVMSPDDSGADLFPDELEITGVLTDFSGTTMVVGGFSVSVLGAEIGDGITIGARVRIHARVTTGETWQAREVQLAALDTSTTGSNGTVSAPAGSEFELRGSLESVSDGFIVISGQRIDARAAEIKTALMLGALVKAHVSLVNGQWVAREVELSGNSSMNDNSSNDNGNDNGSFNDNSSDNSRSNDNGNDNVRANDNDAAVVVPANCTPSQPAGWVTYTIRAGDTLSRIARNTNARLADLALTNCIRDPRFIVAGVSIFVPQAPAFSDDRGRGNDNGNDNGSFDDNGNDNSSFNDNSDDRGGSSGSGRSNDNSSSNDNNNSNDD